MRKIAVCPFCGSTKCKHWWDLDRHCIVYEHEGNRMEAKYIYPWEVVW